MTILIQLLSIAILIYQSHNKEPEISKHTVPVYGNATLGYYYINVYVGTPPQEQSVIIDTGSGQFALPCSQCTSCGRSHIHPPFNIKKSSTNKILTCASKQSICRQSCRKEDSNPCKFSISYAQGSSLSGIVLQDYMQFQKNSIGQNIKTTFGCTTKQTNLFYNQAANGIFGLAPHRNSRFLDLLYQSHTKYTKQEMIFSMCLASEGGELTFGSINKDLNVKDQFVRTTYNDNRNVYTLNSVGKIKINNTILRSKEDLGYYGMFIDSGSTFTYFNYDKFKKLEVQLENICARHSSQCLIAKSKSENNCFKITPKDGQTIKKTINNIFSPIQIEINGTILRWTSDKYFVLRSLANKEVCLAIYGLDRFLLGANWMTNMNIAFNLQEKSISIYPQANCKKLNKLQQSSDSQQLSLYHMEEKSPMQYFQAIIRQDDFFITKIVIMILFILLIFGALIILAQNAQSNMQQKKKQVKLSFQNTAQEQKSMIKVIQNQSNQPSSTQRNLNMQTDQQTILQQQKMMQQQHQNIQKNRNQDPQYQQILPKYSQ